MFRSNRLRRGAAALGLVALLLAPLPARAGGTPANDGSPVGVAMATICGASIAIVRRLPIPIVGGVAVASCFVMVVDALASRD